MLLWLLLVMLLLLMLLLGLAANTAVARAIASATSSAPPAAAVTASATALSSSSFTTFPTTPFGSRKVPNADEVVDAVASPWASFDPPTSQAITPPLSLASTSRQAPPQAPPEELKPVATARSSRPTDILAPEVTDSADVSSPLETLEFVSIVASPPAGGADGETEVKGDARNVGERIPAGVLWRIRVYLFILGEKAGMPGCVWGYKFVTCISCNKLSREVIAPNARITHFDSQTH